MRFVDGLHNEDRNRDEMNYISLRVILKRLRAIRAMMKSPEVSKWKKALVIFGIVYLFLPIDLIPPFLFPFGFVDDLILWIFIILHLKDTLDRFWLGDKISDRKNDIDDIEFEVEDSSSESTES